MNLSFFSAQQILLLDEASKGSFSRVFDYEANDDLNVDGDENAPRTSPFESRFPINFGITGHVAATGEVSMTVKHKTQYCTLMLLIIACSFNTPIFSTLCRPSQYSSHTMMNDSIPRWTRIPLSSINQFYVWPSRTR